VPKAKSSKLLLESNQNRVAWQLRYCGPQQRAVHWAWNFVFINFYDYQFILLRWKKT